MWLPILYIFIGATFWMQTAAYLSANDIPKYENEVKSECLYSECIAPYLNQRFGSPDAFGKGCSTGEFELLTQHASTCEVAKNPCGGIQSVQAIQAFKHLGYLCGLIESTQGPYGSGGGNGLGGGSGGGGGGVVSGDGSGGMSGQGSAAKSLSSECITFATVAISGAAMVFALVL